MHGMAGFPLSSQRDLAARMAVTVSRKTLVTEANRRFWDELCSTSLARSLGITEHSAESLRKFDEAYMALYPYLLRHVPIGDFRSLQVLEVGLGYGTLGERIAQSCASYAGLDVASSPVKMMRHRLGLQGIAGFAVQGSMLDAPFPDASFDRVVSIGCFHHTGDTQRCFDETWRLLRPGGIAHVMVYNRFSALQWNRWPARTLAAWLTERVLGGGDAASSAAQRAAYDRNSAGAPAPETTFHSTGQLVRMLQRFRRVELSKENIGAVTFYGRLVIPRRALLHTVARFAGHDIYVRAEK